jgi:hypothetical protein
MSAPAYKNNGAFSKDCEKLQIYWDSTSLREAKACPRKYQLRIIEGWIPKEPAPALQFGILFHKGLELFSRYLILEDNRKLAVRRMIHEVMLEASNMQKRVNAGDYSEELTEEELAELPHEPWYSPDTSRNIFTLIRALVWYTEQYQDDPAETVYRQDGSPAVELSFLFNTGTEAFTGEYYHLCGHLDRVATFAGKTYVVDAKTTKGQLTDYFFDGFTPDVQMSLYTLAGKIILPEEEVHGVVIDGVQCAVNMNRFGRGICLRNPEQLEDFHRSLLTTIKTMENYAIQNFWPQNETACRLYGRCDFIEVCSESQKVRQNILKTNFVRRQWDPTRSR